MPITKANMQYFLIITYYHHNCPRTIPVPYAYIEKGQSPNFLL